MPCTTLLVGKNASYDGSTIIARNDDSGAGAYMPKKMQVVEPEQQPRLYKSVISHVQVELPDDPMRYTCVPNAKEGEGIWGACGVNEANIAMTATETITSNERVLGGDPLVRYIPATETEPEYIGGIGEEDLVILTIPYIHSAREGVERLGALLEQYGTYESNGIAFQDENEIWWFESIGGHHWMAVRVPDDHYVIMPNQLGIDHFDMTDALTTQMNYMCSKDLNEFIEMNHLDLSQNDEFNPRDAFGSHTDSDHIYNTPRAWITVKYFNPHTAHNEPEDDDIPWSIVPEKKITVEDVKYVLSNHFQGTIYDPYRRNEPPVKYRPIGVNRTDFMGMVQIRPYVAEEYKALLWIAFGSNVFNTMVPVYANVHHLPAYYTATTKRVSTDNFYWASRIIGALADSQYASTANLIERYQLAVVGKARKLLNDYDSEMADSINREEIAEQANNAIAQMVEECTEDTLDKVLCEVSNHMKNGFARSDA